MDDDDLREGETNARVPLLLITLYSMELTRN